MSILDSLYVNLKCPESGIEYLVEIQFKWADPSMRVFKIGSKLEPAPRGDVWVPELYFCSKCKVRERISNGGTLGIEIIKTPDDSFGTHTAYIHLKNGVFKEVLHAKEFLSRYRRDGELDLPKGERLCYPWIRNTW